jgi:hypothetical protein
MILDNETERSNGDRWSERNCFFSEEYCTPSPIEVYNSL